MSDCTPCDKKDDGEVTEEDVGAEPAKAKALPICEKCNLDIAVDQDYEDYAGHFVHTKCMEESLLAIILTAPSFEEIRQFKEARDQMKQMRDMLKDPNMLSKLIGAKVNFNTKDFPLWEESEESKNNNR